MAKKNIILLIFLMLYSFSVFAVTFEPSITVQASVGTTTLIPIQVFNDLGEDLIDFSFESVNFTTFTTISRLESNSSGYVLAKVTPTSSFEGQLSTKSSFFLMRDIPRQPKTFNVELRDDGYIPGIIDVKEGDSVNFTNFGSIVHSVKSPIEGWDSDLAPGTSVIFVLSGVKTIQYFDKQTSLGGVINVLNKTSFEKVNSPELQKPLVLNVKAINPETSLVGVAVTPSFTVAYNKEEETGIIVRNVGNKSSINTVLSGQWMIFDAQGFGLEPGQSKLVKVIVRPEITRSDQTGKAYPLDLFITTSNAPQINLTLTVFIPKTEVITGVTAGDINVEINRIIEFCNQNPSICGAGGNDTKVMFRDRYYTHNFSYQDIVDIQTRQALTVTELEKQSKEQKRINDYLVTTLGSMSESYNKTSYDLNTLTAVQKKSNFWKWFWLVMFIISLIFIVVALGLRRYHEQTRDKEAYEIGV